MALGTIQDILEIEKFLQYQCNKYISDKNRKVMLRGKYKVKGSDKVFSDDDFMAYPLSGCSALEVYECYIKYFNYTIQHKYEKERIAVSAKWDKNKVEESI